MQLAVHGRKLVHGLIAVFLLGGWLGVAVGAGAETYRYTDDRGELRFTDRYESIPIRYRHQMETGLGDRPVNVLPGLNRTAAQPGEDGEPEGGSATKPVVFSSTSSGQKPDLEALRSLGMGFVLGMLLLVPLAFLLSAQVLRWSAAWAGVTEVPVFGTACWILFVIFLAQLGFAIAAAGFMLAVGILELAAGNLGGAGALQSPAANALLSLASIGVSGQVLGWMLDTSFLRGLLTAFLHSVVTTVLMMIPVLALLFAFGGMALLSGVSG